MSRYTGPRLRVLRRLGTHLPGLTRKSSERRSYPPGQHGENARRKLSDYAIHLMEKQKLRLNYGLTETQLTRTLAKAVSSRIETGERVAQLLEGRLDAIVFRAGLAPTIPAARQLVNHGHITLNGRKTDIASALIRPGDVVALRPASQKLASVAESLGRPTLPLPDYLQLQSDPVRITVARMPSLADIPFEIQMHLVVEHYAR